MLWVKTGNTALVQAIVLEDLCIRKLIDRYPISEKPIQDPKEKPKQDP
jgi:hypothetical protein